jgi:putative DNA primase/helicase
LLIFAHGAGANEKSTMLGTLRKLAADYGVQLDPAVLTAGQHDQHPTGLTDLRGARLVTTVETEANRRLAEALVKQLTGGDPIRARRMRGDYFEFWPTHTIWLAGNHLPAIRGTDLGIWRRAALVPFDVTFEGERQDPELRPVLRRSRPESSRGRSGGASSGNATDSRCLSGSRRLHLAALIAPAMRALGAPDFSYAQLRMLAEAPPEIVQ